MLIGHYRDGDVARLHQVAEKDEDVRLMNKLKLIPQRQIKKLPSMWNKL
jgi:hypothetical protein